MISKRFLGPLDADWDVHFRDHLVLQDQVMELMLPESHIVYGAKGSGKTALRRALTEMEARSFFTTGTINIDHLSIQRLHVELDRLKDTTGDEVMSLARSVWRNVIAISFLEVMRDRVPEKDVFCRRVTDVLQDEQFTDRDTPNRILNQVQRFFEKLGNLTAQGDPKDNGRDTESRRMIVDRFPPSVLMEELLTEAHAIVVASGKAVAICIDGFDSIVDHSPESRKAVFAGLIDAIYRLAKDKALSEILCVKAFLPKELTHEARSPVWDADKFLYNTVTLHWDDVSLKEFIVKRLAPHARSQKKTDFDSIWHEFMPAVVRNSVHEFDETSFDYILRHTQFRPRQLLFHVQSILDKWDRKPNSPFRVDGSFIPSTVAASNRVLAELAVEQLEYARPGVGSFVRSFGGGTSTISYSECYSKIARMFGSEPLESRRIFDELFDFGVIGIARRENVIKGASKFKVRFVYAGEGVSRIHAAEEDVVALSPMFHDLCGCTQSQYGAVIPSPV